MGHGMHRSEDMNHVAITNSYKALMDNSSYRQNFDLGKKNKIHASCTTAIERASVKLQSLVANCCKMRKT
jgi:hypothetical protein